MKTKLTQLRDGLREMATGSITAECMVLWCGNLADDIDAYLTQPAQACEHDWAVGYGVPAYCNHCGVERDPKPAQSVDVEAIRKVITDLRQFDNPYMRGLADKLEAALP